MNLGSSNRQIYDKCSYDKYIFESTSPLNYNTYQGKFENCNKCVHKNNYWVPYHPKIVDVDSELKNITRPLSDCDQFKYYPYCDKSGLCTSTYDKSVPVVPAQEVCPIIYNNIKKTKNPGYHLPDPNFCKKLNKKYK